MPDASARPTALPGSKLPSIDEADETSSSLPNVASTPKHDSARNNARRGNLSELAMSRIDPEDEARKKAASVAASAGHRDDLMPPPIRSTLTSIDAAKPIDVYV